MEKIYYSYSDVEEAATITADTILDGGWMPDYIVGLSRGGLVPAVIMSHYLKVPMHTLQVSLRDHTTGPESNLWMAEDAFGYNVDTPKNILIVDDINDTGATIEWIKQDWQAGCMPNDPKWDNVWHNNVRFAVLTNNKSSKEVVDYNFWEVDKAEKDCWLVYPWEVLPRDNQDNV